jgi:hypothetical protein
MTPIPTLAVEHRRDERRFTAERERLDRQFEAERRRDDVGHLRDFLDDLANGIEACTSRYLRAVSAFEERAH